MNFLHPFERTIGPGPYRVVGFFDLGRCVAALQAGNVNAYNNGLAMAPQDVAIGSCAHCGQGILNNFIVQTGDGRRHAIGSDCIAKCSLPATELSKVQRIERERSKAQRVERKRQKGEHARAAVTKMLQTESRLSSLPHPTPYLASQGKTLRDYAEYCVEKSTDGGILLVLKTLKSALQNTP